MPQNENSAGVANGNGAGDARDRWSPPYISFTNVMHLLDRLENNLPPRIDRSFLTGSNAVNTMTLAALRALDLIDAEGHPQEGLIALATRPDERKELLADLLRRFYPEPVELGSINATQSQLEEAFGRWGISGDTRRKAIAFYLKAADFAGVPISANFRTPSVTRADGGARRNGRRRQPAPSSSSGASADQREDTEPQTGTDAKLAALRSRYIEMLVNKVETQDELDTDLLDRIESLLGFREEDD
ncbi:MAG: hypothetical protein H0X65_17935 [Gemmatimonadetes bacterium]|jgi:hypothetical protein|nr:hypothetical protein [Gemmatimonadota bacterium]